MLEKMSTNLHMCLACLKENVISLKIKKKYENYEKAFNLQIENISFQKMQSKTSN